MTDKQTIDGLKLLREPFPASQIGKLPKGGIMLDFVGHGYLTARFLDADPHWSWEPVAYDSMGLPLLDEYGGLWIKLTLCGVTRLGYGDAGSKKGPNAIKEAIGDALRNAGMRFGAALDLWCKGDPDAPEEMSPHAKAEAAKVEAANIARGELLEKLKPFGWNPKALIDRFRDDYAADLLAADEETVRAFGEALVDEAKEQLRESVEEAS